ncbi:MAG: protein kinase [Myxococcaceae bacterium]|nr:protein kinase [Myxococcaceae bacterium]
MSGELVGQALSHFQILEKLGQGGMGIVYKAVDMQLRRTVALKVLPPEAMRQPERRARFLREAYSAAVISHPNIATIYEVGEAGGYVFIAMELVEGRTLRKLIQDRSLSLEEIVRIARDIARGLSKAHDKGVIHRDIKPDNVMVGVDQDVKVLDFGLAKLREPEAAGSAALLPEGETVSLLTEVGQLLGSPGYMSPEQATGKPVDHRTDLFSFGVLLYELVTGKRPFMGYTAGEQIVAICRDEPEPASKLNPALPPRLEQVIRTCMAKKPGDRYASARELLAELEALVQGATPGASSPPISAPQLPMMPSGGGPLLPALRRAWPVLVSLAAVGLLAVFALGSNESLEQRPQGATPEALGSSNPEARLRYAAAMRGWRDNIEGACKLFAEAIQLDPSFAAAYLRLSLCHAIDPARGRQSFQKAAALRELLSERDQFLLDAYEPVFQRLPADFEETLRRIQRAQERFPSDAEFFFLRSGIEAYFDFSASMAAIDHALTLDPGFSRAWRLRGEVLAYLGSFDEAFRSLKSCLDVSPAATSCLRTRINLQEELGDCAAAEADARRWLTVAPDPDAYQYLADALSVRGGSLPSVEEALKQKRARLGDERERQKEEGWDAVRLALLKGDLNAALAGTRQLQILLANSPQEDEHAALASMRVSIFQEIGQEAEAAREAESFLARRDAWEPNPRSEDWAISRDVTARLLAVMRRAGVISREEAERRLAERLSGWHGKVAPHVRNFLWIHFYAAPAATPEEGREAMAALEQYQPLPPHKPLVPGDAYIGQAFLLGGRVDEALPALERMAKSCYALRYPMEYLRNHYFLGQAREAKGDTAGACAAYAAVLEHWGSARPRSVTAELTLGRGKALRCPAN